jgi:osmotically-inducible protein OsmY
MKRFLLAFLLGVIAGCSGFWVFRDGPLAKKITEASPTSIPGRVMGAVEQQIAESRAEEVKQQLEASGSLVREKMPPRVAYDDEGVNDVIVAKLKADPTLAGAKIKSETKAGEATLRGTATSYEQIARALRLALETEGTRKVTVTIKLASN